MAESLPNAAISIFLETFSLSLGTFQAGCPRRMAELRNRAHFLGYIQLLLWGKHLGSVDISFLQG